MSTVARRPRASAWRRIVRRLVRLVFQVLRLIFIVFAGAFGMAPPPPPPPPNPPVQMQESGGEKLKKR